MFFTQNMTQHNPYNPNRERSYIRVLHAVPNAPAVDVYANGNPIARNLRYKEFTQYLPVPAGTYKVDVYPAGQTTNAVLTTTVTLPGKSIFTVAATGLLPDISLLPIAEPKTAIPPNMVFVRFSHLSPTAPKVDITLPDGTVLFGNVGFRETTEYIMVPPTTYTLQARIAGTDKVVLTVPGITLRPNRFYTVYAVGLPGEEPPLQALIPLDGNSYINP